jgi:hypothetical protein
MAVSRQPGLVLYIVYARFADLSANMTQLEHVVAFLSKHADGPLKNVIKELQDKLIELRASCFLVIVCAYAICLTM